MKIPYELVIRRFDSLRAMFGMKSKRLDQTRVGAAFG